MRSDCFAVVLSICLWGDLAGKPDASSRPVVTQASKSSSPFDDREQLAAEYAKLLEQLQQEIAGALPAMDEDRKSQYLKCREAELAAQAAVKQARQRLAEVAKAQALVDHARRKWIGGAEAGIAEAVAKRNAATSDSDRRLAEAELAKWEANKSEGQQALQERQAALEQAQRDQPAAQQALNAAEQALQVATAQTLAAIDQFKLEAVLANPALDAQLAKFVVLLEATPRGLAEFAVQGQRERALLDKLLSDESLLLQMVIADGAKGGRYGRAMQIYDDIQQASPRASEGNLQRLALAISLEHAIPIGQRNAVSATDAPHFVDPVQRYLHFERAYLGRELDPCFKDLTVWDYRMVVDGEEPDEILAWGREMLRNYRPDQITRSDYRWRYVQSVQTEIKYGSQDNQYDRDDLQFFQNILMNGGVCGRRAFFGRFILRAFGVPTTARPQPGHAALVHWTPDGWVICLGANWGSGRTKTRYQSDLEFLAHTQARAAGGAFLQVKRAQWIGDVLGEARVFGFQSGSPGFWYALSLYHQQRVIEQSKARTLAAIGEDIAEANESRQKESFDRVQLGAADRKISVSPEGVVTIPASATTQPTSSTGKIIFMDSVLGGKQLHYSRNGKPEDFHYVVDVPTSGRYHLTARVVTPSWRQILQLQVNGAAQMIEIDLPFTVGKWETTQPREIELNQGTNHLRFSRPAEVKGCSIKDFTLTPVKQGS